MIQLVNRRHPALHRRAARIAEEDGKSFFRLADEMIAYCQAGRGRAALAAPQVGRSVALIVTRDGDVVANPEILVDPEDRLCQDTEACLSLPGRLYVVERYIRCLVKGVDLEWNPVRIEAHGWEARLWQHEGDHLDGRLISDNWPEVARR